MGWTLRPADTRADSGGGVLGRGQRAPPHHDRRLGGVVSSSGGVRGGAPENLDSPMEHFGTLEITSEWSASF